MVAPRDPPLPPNRLFREFESGRMPRAEFQRAMAVHARELIAEMEEERRNPVAAFVEHIRNRRAATRLAKAHGEAAVREVFATLAELRDFPPASLLWNASHRHVPLYCFLRMTVEPLFRVLHLRRDERDTHIEIEHRFFGSQQSTRELITLRRGWHGNLYPVARRRI